MAELEIIPKCPTCKEDVTDTLSDLVFEEGVYRTVCGNCSSSVEVRQVTRFRTTVNPVVNLLTLEPVSYAVMDHSNGVPMDVNIRIESRGQDAWVVKNFESVLNKNGAWEIEPLRPSSRTSDFIERTRFPTAHAAFAFLRFNV